MERVVALYLVAVAVQALHVLEEFRTGFHRSFPLVIGLKPWSDAFFITLNLVALALFVLFGAALSYGLGYGSSRYCSCGPWHVRWLPFARFRGRGALWTACS